MKSNNDKSNKTGWTQWSSDYTDKGLRLPVGDTLYEVGTPELSDYLRDKIAENAGLENAIKELNSITVDTVVLWSNKIGNKPVSQKTAELFLEKQEDAGNLIAQTDNLGRKFWTQSRKFNNDNPLSKVQREARASIEDLRKKGYRS